MPGDHSPACDRFSGAGTNYAVEALSHCKGAGDKRRVAERPRIWRSYARSSGFGEEAISLFSKALDGFRELKTPQNSRLIRYLAALITAPFEDAARPILSSHVRNWTGRS